MPSAPADPRGGADALDLALLTLAGLGVAALATAAALLVRAVPGFRWQGVPALVVALLALAALLGLAGYLLINRARAGLHQRLRELREAARSLAGGDLEAAVPEGDDEVGALGRSLNALATRAARLLHAQRDLLSGVSHELRSPLARISVALELIEIGRGEGDAELVELLQGVREEVALLERHIARLLEAQRVSSQRVLLSRKPTCVDLLVRGVVERERLRLQRLGWQLELELETGDLELLLDENAIDRVLSTLVENAVQHAATPDPEGGPPPAGWQPSLRVEARSKDGAVVIAVLDRGPGLSEDQCALAFEPFARIDRSRSSRTGGTGLGLYLARTICEAHGGHAAAWPRPGGGLVVGLRLPEREARDQRATMRVEGIAEGAPPVTAVGEAGTAAAAGAQQGAP